MPLRPADGAQFSCHSGRNMLEQSLTRLDWERGLTRHDWYLNKTMGCQVNNYASYETHLQEALMIGQPVLHLREDLLG